MNAATFLPTPLPAAPMPLGARLRLALRQLRRRLHAAQAPSPVAGVLVMLERQQLHSVRHPQGREIRCLEGRLWLTFENCPTDIFLRPGETLQCGTHHKLVMQAITPARCLIV